MEGRGAERDGLADAVAWVARSLPSRPPVAVLGGILLDAGSEDGSGEALTVSGFDYEVSAQCGVPATIADGGKAPAPTEGLDFYDTGVQLVTDTAAEGLDSIDTTEGTELCWG